MSSGGDLVAKAKKFREVETVQHENVPNVAEALERWSKFLQEHETPSPNDCTHVIFDNYPDWWMSSKPSYKLAVAEENTLELLYSCISQLYDLGIPLTLTERRTPEIRFVQDIEIWGTKEETVSVEDLMNPESQFARLLGQTMGKIYPGQAMGGKKFLDVVCFDASGFSRTKGVLKTSVRLVWSSIIVDKERAATIRDYMTHKFKDSKEAELRALETRVLEYSKENHWGSIFSDALYFGKHGHGVRMPLCDRVSPAPLKKPERRPFKPFGVLRFQYGGGDVQAVEQVCGKDELEGPEWLKIGCIRRDAGSDLTEWELPKWNGERLPRTTPSSAATQSAGRPPPSATTTTLTATGMSNRTPGQVRTRTHGGSGDYARGRYPRRAPPTQEAKAVTIDREFDGTADEFRERLETAMGDQGHGGTITQDEGILSWRDPEKGMRIEFKASNKRVYIIGTAAQVRSILSVIGNIVQAVGGEVARSTTTARSAASRNGSEYERAPSAVYAPCAVYSHAPSQVYAMSTASHASSAREGGKAEKRQVHKAFEPQGAGELRLEVNDFVTVTHDPEETQHDKHRWVYGINETTQQSGWFPSSNAYPVQVSAEETGAEVPDQ